ncbi:hypothetical protein PIN31009_00794 [Pandoraea iniqua]|nr:hypothetical protein PIN31009_00794 [Pandoraea iniqua]
MDIFDPRPSAERAVWLARENLLHSQKSLDYLLDACEGCLPDALRTASHDFLRSLSDDSTARASGLVFTAIWRLANAIRRKDESEIHMVLTNLVMGSALSARSCRFLVGSAAGACGADRNFLHGLGDDTYETVFHDASPNAALARMHTLDDCLRRLRSIDPVLHGEVAEIVNEIYLFEATTCHSRDTLYAGSDFHRLGCLYVNAVATSKPAWFWLDKLVRESAHQVMLSLMIHDEFVLNDDSERYTSPLRKEPRTVTGIYHAMFVVYRIVHCFRRALATQTLTDAERSYIADSITQYERKFSDAHRVLIEHGKLTAGARHMLDQCRHLMQEIHA